MRFEITDHDLILDRMTSEEWQIVGAAPEASDPANQGDNAEVFLQQPLYEDLVEEAKFSDSDEDGMDWGSLQHDGYMTDYFQHRQTVESDLKQVESCLVEGEDLPPILEPLAGEMIYRLFIPREHAASWYFVLNQARLLLNNAHDLADAPDRQKLQNRELSREISPERLHLFALYEVFSVLQSILIENGLLGEVE